jgi:hypothetical protein
MSRVPTLRAYAFLPLLQAKEAAAAEAERKVAAYDRLMENLAEQERIYPGVPLTTEQIRAVLEGE